MRGINPDDILTIKTNNGRFNSRSIPGVGDSQILNDTSLELLRQHLKNDTMGAFISTHPDWVASS